jgi:hypothetical protein
MRTRREHTRRGSTRGAYPEARQERDLGRRLVSLGVDRQDKTPVEQRDSRIALEQQEEQRRARAHEDDASIGAEGGVARPRARSTV